MEDATYLENLLRLRACAVCGADRKSREVPLEATCAVCKGPVPREDAIFAIGLGAARLVCSTACLEVSLQEGLVGGTSCPMCGSPWSEARPMPRACAICAADLRLDEGYAGRWRGGGLQTFCGPKCLDAYLARANPFCG